MTKTRDRIRKSRRKIRAALPSRHAIERVRLIVHIRDHNPSEEMVIAAAIVWEEAHKAIWAWANDSVVLGSRFASLGDEIDAGTDNVVRGFCDERFASDPGFFSDDCDMACYDLDDFAKETGGWSSYRWNRIGKYSIPAWDRVLSRCVRAGLPWEDLGLLER